MSFSKANGFGHQGIANFQASEFGQRQDTPNGWLLIFQAGFNDAGIRGQFSIFKHRQMPGMQIQPIYLLIGAGLLHHKHRLPGLDDCVQFPRGQIVQLLPLKNQIHLYVHDDSNLLTAYGNRLTGGCKYSKHWPVSVVPRLMLMSMTDIVHTVSLRRQ